MNRFCPRCGSPVSPNARFCRNCGHRLPQPQQQNMNNMYQGQTLNYNNRPYQSTNRYQPNYNNVYQNQGFHGQYQQPNNMYRQTIQAYPTRRSFADAGQNAYLIKVYGWMFTAMIVAGISAAFGASSGFLIGGWMPLILSIIGWIPMWYVYKNSATDPGEGVFGLMAFAVIEGLSLSGIFVYYTGADLSMAFISSSLVFAAMCGIGMTTNKDLSQMRTQLYGALIALIIGSIITLLFTNSFVILFLSIVGVIIFSGFAIVDTNDAIKLYRNYKGQASITGLALMSAMTLFIDFINLFVDLLELIGIFDRN